MRWKLSRQESEIYRCCLCCHVRTGTLILGIVLMIGLICLLSTVIASMIIPDRMEEMMHISAKKPTTPHTPVVSTSRKNSTTGLFIEDDVTHEDDKFVEIVWCVGMLGICSMLVYGTISGKSGYLMPFFCVQVFLFCIISLYIISYVSAIPDMKKWLEMQESFPYKEYLMTMDSDFLMLVAVFIFGVILVVQAYLIGMVWSCYKYMSSYETTAASRMRSYGDDLTTVEGDTEMLLPPKYEDVLRMSAEEPAPPPYVADE